ncbi:MAG: hypothetical protein MJ077_12030 [Oscillospiraceae bacterium]|nr:hypothetical protein [Oscillospiraceae bacterium]
MSNNEHILPDVKNDIPDYAIERMARCLLPMIQEYYESEEGKRELAKWEHRKEDTQKNANN